MSEELDPRTVDSPSTPLPAEPLSGQHSLVAIQKSLTLTYSAESIR